MDPFIGCDKRGSAGAYWNATKACIEVFVGNFLQQHLFISQLLPRNTPHTSGIKSAPTNSNEVRQIFDYFLSIYLLLRGGHERNPLVDSRSANMCMRMFCPSMTMASSAVSPGYDSFVSFPSFVGCKIFRPPRKCSTLLRSH